MSTNYRENNLLINDPVPRNASKYPIHQTYLTDDAERTGTGGYKFKAPEVWSSARSGKKSIAIRSIQWLPKTINLTFGLTVTVNGTNKTFNYTNAVPINVSLYDALNSIIQYFDAWTSANSLTISISYEYYNNSHNNQLTLDIYNTTAPSTKYTFRIHSISDAAKPSESFNELLNQPKDYFPSAAQGLFYHNVWDRSTALNFHASFVPFDNYQNIGTIFDKWNTPIIYQDPNTSPLFNVWVTSDLKTPMKLLYESFVFRLTFIISTESQYHS